MKKKKSVLCVLLLLCLGLTACSGKDSTENSGNGAVKHQVKKNSEGEIEEQLIDLKKYSLEYENGSDQQTCFAWNQMAKSDLGYYMWGTGEQQGMLLFMDADSEAVVPLCNQPNCKHEGEKTCDAYYPSYGMASSFYDNSWVQYYEDLVYTIGCDSDRYVSLYAANPDGSNRRKSTSLYRCSTTDEGTWSSPKVAIHRGYVYFINPNNEIPKLEKIAIGESGKTEVIYEVTGTRPTMYRIQAYGDYVFFQTGYFKDEEMIDIIGGIYAYNTKSNEVTCVKTNAVSSYMISDNQLYFGNETGISCYSLSDQTEKEIISTKEAYPEFSLSKDYIYAYVDNAVDVYDFEGNKVDSIANGVSYTEYYYGDDQFLFAKKCEQEELIKLSIEEFLNNNGRWDMIVCQ